MIPITINCQTFGIFYDDEIKNIFQKHLNHYDELCVTRETENVVVDVKIGEKNVRINVMLDGKDAEVCLIGDWSISSSAFIQHVETIVSYCKSNFPTVPIVIAGFDDGNNDPHLLECINLLGGKLMTKAMGKNLARRINAVKYIECSKQSGRGAKILIDEIAYAGLEKLRDEQVRKAKCNAINKWRKNTCYVAIFLVLSMIISIFVNFISTQVEVPNARTFAFYYGGHAVKAFLSSFVG